MATTISASNGSISILKTGSTDEALYPASSIYMLPVQGNPGYFSIKRVSDNSDVIQNTLYSDITNGDTGLAFASSSALKTYIKTNFFYKAGGASGIIGGSDKQVQFNNAGAFGGDSNFIWDNTNKRLGIGGTPGAYNLDITGTVRFQGASIALTVSTSDNSTNIATTAFVKSVLPVRANPSVSAGLTAVNGSATTFMSSDSAPAISQTITPTWSGLHTWNQNGLAVTPADALLIGNTTVSTSGVPFQISPGLNFQNHTWNTSGTPADNIGNMRMYLRGNSGASPFSTFNFDFSQNGGSYLNAVSFDGFGKVTAGNFLASTNVSAKYFYHIAVLATVNATATLTAAQMQTGVKCTSTTAVTFTTPTATALATQLGSVGSGFSYEFVIDNSASTSAGAITITLGSGFTSGLNAGLTVAIGKSQKYVVYFSSTSAGVISQIM